MKLSVVIVNYNVRFFLEQCLQSVERAAAGLDVEVFVVDNNSVDDSVRMVAEKFPGVKLIANKENTGFSKANNQAMRITTGEYILLLNPDTVVEEQTFRKVIEFMDAHPDAGGLGVRMVDGKGNFLPESKRGLPTPDVAFYKIFGISRLFPSSKRFNKYYLGHLSPMETNKIEILSGAFMLMRKEALDKVGLLDEAFFMYGEDIDLSWRIILGGYSNYYFPETTIIHYKGESTKKGSLNYVFVFYNAMIIFARKHFSEKNAKMFSFFINLAIWLRAGVAILYRFVQRAVLPVADVALTMVLLFMVKDIYASAQEKIYSTGLITVAFAVCSLIWTFSAWLAGGYDKPIRPLRVVKPIIIGSAVILIGYALLPETLRFSRALLLLGSGIAMFVWIFNRVLFSLISTGSTGIEKVTNRKIAVIGKSDEVERVRALVLQIGGNYSEFIPVDTIAGVPETDHIADIVRVHKLDQIIFCARDISSAQIINTMSALGNMDIEFKIASPESSYIIGSNSIETGGDIFIMDVNSVSLPVNRRIKRTLDVFLSLVFLILAPLNMFIVRKPMGYLSNIVKVLAGKISWVGTESATKAGKQLQALKTGVLVPGKVLGLKGATMEQTEKINLVYARDYKVLNDLKIIRKGWRDLGA